MSETIMFNISAEFKEALESAVGPNKSRAEFIREAVAKSVKYDLSKEPKSTRKSKYASPEERAAAQKARAKSRRELTSKLLAAYEQEDSEEAIMALMASLKTTE